MSFTASSSIASAVGAVISIVLRSASLTSPMLSGFTGSRFAIASASSLSVSGSLSSSVAVASLVSSAFFLEHPLKAMLTVTAATAATAAAFLNFLILFLLLMYTGCLTAAPVVPHECCCLL